MVSVLTLIVVDCWIGSLSLKKVVKFPTVSTDLALFEDTKGVIRKHNRRRTYNTMGKRKRTKGQTTIYKTLHIKLKIEHHKPH